MKTLVIDFSRVLIFADDMTVPSFGVYYRELASQPGFEFTDHFFLNTELLNVLQHLATPVYMYSDGGMHRLEEVRPQIQNIFRSIITTEDVGKKNNPDSYRKLGEFVGQPVSDILFIDDKRANIEAAQAAGCQAVRYESNAQIVPILEAL